MTVPSPDQDARRRAVDPTENVVLEASAGTGKTRVLVERYLNLLRAGVDPDNILAITFSRKAAAEMRDRIVDRLREASRTSELDLARWRDLRDRLSDIALLDSHAKATGEGWRARLTDLFGRARLYRLAGANDRPGAAAAIAEAIVVSYECDLVTALIALPDRKSTRLNSSHIPLSRMPSSA